MLLPHPPLPPPPASSPLRHPALIPCCLDINEEQEVMKMMLNATTTMPHVGFAPQPPPPGAGAAALQPGPQPGQIVYCAHCPTNELPGPLFTQVLM